MAQHAVGAPVLRQFHSGAREVAVELFQLRFEAREQGERVSGGSRKTGQDLVVVDAAQLLRGRFQDFVAEGHLPIARHHYFVVSPDTENRRRAYALFH